MTVQLPEALLAEARERLDAVYARQVDEFGADRLCRCRPFGSYKSDPLSIFMTKALGAPAATPAPAAATPDSDI